MAKKGTLRYTCKEEPPPPKDIPISPPYDPIAPICQPVCQWAIDFAICPWIGYGEDGYDAWLLAWRKHDRFYDTCLGEPYQVIAEPDYPLGILPGLYRTACLATRYGPPHCPACPVAPDVDETLPEGIPAKEYDWSRDSYAFSEFCCDQGAFYLHGAGKHTIRPSTFRCRWDTWTGHIGMKVWWEAATGMWRMDVGDMITTSQYICHYHHEDPTGFHPEGAYEFYHCWKGGVPLPDCTCPEDALAIILTIHEE